MTSLTVSTLGAPDDDLETVLGWLKATGVSAIELRLSAGQLAHPAMTATERAELGSRISDAGVAVSGIASYVQVASDAKDEMVVGSLAAAMKLAADLGAPMVRVFPGAPAHSSPYDRKPELREPVDDVTSRAVARLNAVAPLAEELGVYPALETHDSHPCGADIVRILERCDGPVGAVWDLMHPWRTGEPLQHTWDLLSPWLSSGRGCVQIKDANLPEDRTPLPIGTGTLPVDEFAELLIREGYDAPICLEWEKAWHPSAANLGVALDSTKRWFDRHWPNG